MKFLLKLVTVLVSLMASLFVGLFVVNQISVRTLKQPHLKYVDEKISKNAPIDIYKSQLFLTTGNKNKEIFQYITAFSTIDNIRKRVPVNPIPNFEKGSQKVYLLGGSFVVGKGLADSETLWYRLQHKFNQNNLDVGVHLLARSSWTFTHFFALLKTKHRYMEQFRTEKPVKVYYLYPGFHHSRVNVSVAVALSNLKYFDYPLFRVIDGQVQFLGTYRHNYPLLIPFLEKLNSLEILSFNSLQSLGLSQMTLYSSDPKDFWQIFSAFCEEFKTLAPNSHFFVLPYPGVEAPIKSVSQENFEVLQAKEYFKDVSPDDFIPFDGHPKGNLNSEISEYLFNHYREIEPTLPSISEE